MVICGIKSCEILLVLYVLLISYITPRQAVTRSCWILLMFYVLCIFFPKGSRLCKNNSISNLMMSYWYGGWTIWPGRRGTGNWYLMSKHGELSLERRYNPRNTGFPNNYFPFLRRHVQGGTVTLSSNFGCAFTDPWCCLFGIADFYRLGWVDSIGWDKQRSIVLLSQEHTGRAAPNLGPGIPRVESLAG